MIQTPIALLELFALKMRYVPGFNSGIFCFVDFHKNDATCF